MERDAHKERLAALGEIAAEVAHELRNALLIISTSVYVARQDPAVSEPHLAKIDRHARLAQGIVEDLMALARGEPAVAEPTGVRELLALAREGLPDAGAVFMDELAPPDLLARAHPGLTARLLHALYENAIAAAAPRPARVVTRAFAHAGPAGPRVVLEVADDGPGVPPDIAASVFEPLVTARRGGSGLGLAMARRIAHAHGGTIALLEGAPAGATFRVELPA